MADPFLRAGHRCEAINFYIKGKTVSQISLKEIDSNYSFILMLPQSETERFLLQRLEENKNKVERSCELIDIKQTDHAIVSTLRLANGEDESVVSDWLVACDGANSTIRKQCKIDFTENIVQSNLWLLMQE